MSSEATTVMARETAEAPAVVAGQLATNARFCAALGERLRMAPPTLVTTCARGSSDHAATYAKYLIEIMAGVPVASAAPSIASVYRAPLRLDGALHVAISQSGRSPDIVAGAEQARAGGAYVVALVNDTESPLAAAADVCLPLLAGPETSVAATKSFIASLTAIAHLVAAWTRNQPLVDSLERLPDWLATAARADWSTAEPGLARADDLLVIGRGVGLGIAQEAALKLKETASLHAEAFSAAELRHGPLAIVRRGLPVLAFLQDDATRPSMAQLIADLGAKGADVRVAAADRQPGWLPLPEGMHPSLAPIATIQSFYPLANRVALARGHDPDRPQHLQKVTETH